MGGTRIFKDDVEFSTAIANFDNDAITGTPCWSVQHLDDEDTLSVWGTRMMNLQNRSKLGRITQIQRKSEHITGLGLEMPSGNEPARMAWTDIGNIGKRVRYGQHVRSLCVTIRNEDRIHPWVTSAAPDTLGDRPTWDDMAPGWVLF